MKNYFSLLRIGVLICIILVQNFQVLAQENNNDTLPSVIVIDSFKKTFNPKSTFQNLEPGKVIDHKSKLFYQTQSLANLIQAQTNVFIKNYGTNNLSTLSIRGTSAAQSQVIWNHIPLNSAVTGYSDLSLLTAGFFDAVQLQYSGSSSLYGNGNMGGTVLLQSQSFKQDFFQANFSFGSFSNYKAFLKAGWIKDKHKLQVRAIGLMGKNNFSYQDLYGQKQNLQHALQQQAGVLADYQTQVPLFSKIHPLIIDLHSWYQYDYRAIPPTLYENISVKNQTNNNWRNALSFYQSLPDDWNAYLHFGWQQEQYQYQDSLAFQFQNYKLQNVYAEFGLHSIADKVWKNTRHSFLFFVPFQAQFLQRKGNNNVDKTIRGGIAAAYQIKWKDQLAFQIKLRQEWQQDLKIPLVYGALLSYQGLQQDWQKTKITIPLFVSIQNGFRVPTLNELYFFPGGNPNLKPESSFNLEVGWSLHLQPQNNAFRSMILKSAFFHRQVEDWIYWLGNSIWTPYNIAAVRTYGWDWQWNMEYEIIDGLRLIANSDYAYTIATTQSSYISGSNSIGKQIPYTPRYLINSNLGAAWGQFFFQILHQYSGYRFTQLDESEFLPPYTLWGFQASYYFTLPQNQVISTQFQVQNLTNLAYQSVRGRPMPPLQALLTVSISL